MNSYSRRDFMGLGLAAVGVGGFILQAGAQSTPPSGDLGSYGRYVDEDKDPANPAGNRGASPAPAKWTPTEDNILGPFHRLGAPFRAKITPPLEPGTVVVISGRVWGHDTRKPLVNTVIDIWQANAMGRYDNDDPGNPPKEDTFVNRARLITDEAGYYEYETIHPGRYQIGQNLWRPAHIHYLVRQPGYKDLVTQLYFKGDPHNKTDRWVKESLIVDIQERKVRNTAIEVGTFDIVLAAAK